MKGLGLLRWLVTLLIIGAAVFVVQREYRVYLHNPWTRDGLVSAEVIPIAPSVSGQIKRVAVQNNQAVRAGDVLFVVEDRPYALAVQLAEAELLEAQAMLEDARQRERREPAMVGQAAPHRKATSAVVQGAVSGQSLSAVSLAAASVAEASVMAAQVRLEQARDQLAQTQILAPVDGFVSTVALQQGMMAVAYQPCLGLIDAASFRIEAFFPETVLRQLQEGDTALVTLMAYPDTVLTGKVRSIGRGIARHDGSTGSELLPVVSATFEWIRLAQRMPVTVTLDPLPEGVVLRKGLSASVLLETEKTTLEHKPIPRFLQ